MKAPQYDRKSIFLAGGITGCPNWQQKAEQLLKNKYEVHNPRQENFDVTNPHAAREQIEWESHYLNRADVIIFWFCEETIQPIALFELGRWSYVQKRIFVGADLNYPRRVDVVEQLRLARPELYVYTDLDILIDDVLVVT